MDEPITPPLVASTSPADVPSSPEREPVLARGSGHIERTENSVMEGLPAAKVERIAAMRRDLAELQRHLIDAQQRIATELQGRAEDAERFEALELKAQHDATRAAELEIEVMELRTQAATTEELRVEIAARDTQLEELRTQLERQFAALRDANAAAETRDAALAKITAERADFEHARRELEAMRAKTSEVANQLLRVGQELIDGSAAGADAEAKPVAPPPRVERPQPPPLPKTSTQPAEAPVQVETIIDLTEPRVGTSRLGAALLVIGGLVVGCAATFAIVNRSHAEPSQAPVAAPLAAEAAPEVAPVVVPAVAPAAAPAPVPTVEPATQAAALPVSSDGVLVLPPSAKSHRVYVDGDVVEVEDLRATVPCGARDIRIGSRGATQKIDVACGGETSLSADP